MRHQTHYRSGHIYFFLFVLILSLQGCRDFFISEVTDIDIPGSEPQIVIFSYISPQDSIIKVQGFSSMPYSGHKPEYRDVNVFMAKKGDERTRLTFSHQHIGFVVSRDEFAVEPGFYYNLWVETSDGKKIEAECYIPELEYEHMKIEEPYRETSEWDYEELMLEWKLTTSPDRVNYFSSGAYIKNYQITASHGSADTLLVNISDLWLSRGTNHVTDDGGQTHIFRANSWQNSHSFYPGQPITLVDSAFVYILQTDKNYYLFHKSIIGYNYHGDDSPFTESVLIYSNIKGGLGVFAGYNRKDFYIPLSP
jgi:hypothetical protein